MTTTTQLETVIVNVEKGHRLDDLQPSLSNIKIFKVYKVTNTTNGMSYIGYTSRRLCDRWDEHVANSRGQRKRKSKLYTAIAEHGSAAFSREVLFTTEDEAVAKRLEKECIEKYDTYNSGYNSNLGGCGFHVYTDEWKARVHEGRRLAALRRQGILSSPEKPQAKAEFWDKGDANPMAKTYRVRCPDGSEVMVAGMKQFCREHGIRAGDMCSKYGRSKGYVVLERFNDQKFTSYAQASGNGE